MNKKVKLMVLIGAVTACGIACAVSVVLLLHNRNVDVVETTVSAVHEETPTVAQTLPVTEETEMFSNNLSDLVGNVVVSTYIEKEYVDACLAAISKVMKENTAIYFYSVYFDRNESEYILSYYVYEGDSGEFSDDEVTLNLEDTEHKIEPIFESYEGQVTVMK